MYDYKESYDNYYEPSEFDIKVKVREALKEVEQKDRDRIIGTTKYGDIVYANGDNNDVTIYTEKEAAEKHL